MSYDAKLRKEYAHATDQLSISIEQLLTNLGGKPAKGKSLPHGQFDVNFNKKINGEFINNRIQLKVKVAPVNDRSCTVSAMAYPVDPVGQKLAFGVIGEPAKHVLDVMFSFLDAQFG